MISVKPAPALSLPPLPAAVMPPTRMANISPSSIECYRLCPRLFMWKYRCGLSPLDSYSHALTVGTLYHEARAMHRLAASSETVAERLATLTEKLGAEFVQAADEVTGLLPNGKALDDILEQIDMAEATAIMLAEAANTFLPWPPNQDEWKMQSREKTYEVKLPAWNVIQKGRIDSLAENKTKKELWIIDDKTTSMDPALLAQMYRFDPQFQMYLSLAGNVEDVCPTGVVLDVMKKPTIKQKKDQSRLDYIEECREWYRRADHLDCTKRVWVRADSDPLSAAEFQQLIESMAAPCGAPVYPHQFPRNANACTKWNRQCEFMPLCSTDPMTWQATAAAKFTVYTGKGH